MYNSERNRVDFDLRKEVNGESRTDISSRIGFFHNFNIDGIDFQVARSPVPFKFSIYIPGKEKIDISERLDLEQIQEYLLTGKENDFSREYRKG